MTNLTNSLFPVVAMLSALCAAGWVIYRFLENFQDSAKGLTIEESMARQTRTVGRRSEGNGAAAQSTHAADVRSRAGRGESTLHLFSGAPESGAKNRPGNGQLAGQYPRVIYRCPFSIGAHQDGDSAAYHLSHSRHVLSPEMYRSEKAG